MDVKNGLLAFEETISILLFNELHRCICSMEKRIYKWYWFLAKAALSLLLSGGWRIGFSVFYTENYWVEFNRIIWSALISLVILFYAIKMIKGLVDGLKIRGKLGSHNFFIFGLITIAVVSQVTKLFVITARFIIEFQIVGKSSTCLDDLHESFDRGDIGSTDLIMGVFDCCAVYRKKMGTFIFLSPEFCSLLECFFCAGIMIQRKVFSAFKQNAE